jgi:GDP-L-fucose synthase
MSWLKDKRVLVTGSEGFLGRHVIAALGKECDRPVVTVPHEEDPAKGVDLLRPDYVDVMFENVSREGPVDLVLHLAGYNGGLKFNSDRPADIFHRNTTMALNVLGSARKHGAGKVVSMVASCAYPETEWVREVGDRGERYWEKHDCEIMDERQFLDGPPHRSVACHAYAKRNIQIASSFYRKQYGLKAVCVCTPTLVGPGDRTDPDRTKVMTALIKKFVDAHRKGEPEVVCWGSGKPLREFMYVGDAADLILKAAALYDDSDLPLNLGTGQEVSIRDLTEIIAKATGYAGRIRWDETKPDGQYRKRLDITRMEALLGPQTFTPLEEGVRRTVEWYANSGF